MDFKDHFSGHAGIYRQARPSYPRELFAWLAAQAPDRALAWDCGCGNGQATVALAEHFERVVGTDPSASQVENATPHARVEYRVEPAERCSLPDASVSLATVAQALHWIDLPHLYAQVRRVLQPTGVFAVWTYSDCRVDPAVDAVKRRLYVDLTGPYWPPERAIVETGYTTLDFPFMKIAPPTFPMATRWDVEQFLAYLRSWSGTQRYIKATGQDPVALVEAELRAAWGKSDLQREVRWAFHVRCGRP